MIATLTGLAAGLLHVMSGPDHLAAVAPLAAGRDASPWRAGLQWGLGHTAGVVAIGLLLISFRHTLPLDRVSGVSERVVGLALLVVALWTFARARSARSHVHAPAGASFAMGALHGLAGSSHLFGILPALAFGTQLGAMSYLAGFGAGAVLAMTVFSAVVGRLAAGAARRGINAHRGLLYACSVSAFLVGSFWLVA
jgi:hypothetical protein